MMYKNIKISFFLWIICITTPTFAIQNNEDNLMAVVDQIINRNNVMQWVFPTAGLGVVVLFYFFREATGIDGSTCIILALILGFLAKRNRRRIE